MVILLTNANKPVELTAGMIYKVNIEQFRKVLGTAFSYYTLLKKLKEKRWIFLCFDVLNFIVLKCF